MYENYAYPPAYHYMHPMSFVQEPRKILTLYAHVLMSHLFLLLNLHMTHPPPFPSVCDEMLKLCIVVEVT